MSAASSPLPDDTFWMRRALELAERVLYTTTPNPRVGCVIVREGRVLGEGATQPPGGPHAEVVALRAVAAQGLSVAGATVYVTLEPCSHYGRTPPCVDALLAACPDRVVVAMADPNPQVNGQGLAALRAAGIRVSTGVCCDEALALNAGFASRMCYGVPWTWLKMASSLDGRSALHNGVSQWITQPPARKDGQHWRARSCVVLTGIGTVLADNPQLNVRDIATTRQPRKALIDAALAIPEAARLFDGAEVFIFTAQDDASKAQRLAQRNARVIVLPDASQPDRVDLPAAMRWLAAQQINEVHIEAGAGLSGALIEAGCVDELLLYQAPILLGDALSIAQLPARTTLTDVPRYDIIDHTLIGQDLRVRVRATQRWQALLRQVSAST